MFLTSDPGGVDYVTVKLYCVTGDDYRIRGVLVTSSASSALTDANGYAAVLCEEGQVEVSFSGEYAMIKRGNLWESLGFDGFTHQIDATQGATYTAYVQSAYVEDGAPSGGGGGGGKWWDTLLKDFLRDPAAWLFASIIPGVENWVILLVALVLLRR
jgi:hypothetical protein